MSVNLYMHVKADYAHLLTWIFNFDPTMYITFRQTNQSIPGKIYNNGSSLQGVPCEEFPAGLCLYILPGAA